MTDPAIFDPRDLNFKNPYGAVPSGTVVCLTLRPPGRGDFPGDAHRPVREPEQPRTKLSPSPGWAVSWGVDLFRADPGRGRYVGLVWYSFVLERPGWPPGGAGALSAHRL